MESLNLRFSSFIAKSAEQYNLIFNKSLSKKENKLMLLDYIKKYKEIILYGIFGAGATFVNIISFYIVRKASIGLFMSNCLAWFFAFVFAFITNKVFVFESKEWKTKKAIYEMISFTFARLMTLFIDTALMWFLVYKISFNDMLSKIIVNIIVIILNYVLSKFWIFK